MARRTSPMLLRGLLETSKAVCPKAVCPKAVRGNRATAQVVPLWGSCGALTASLPVCPVVPFGPPNRSFVNLAFPSSARRVEYTECRTLGYSPEQMYNVVVDVDQYQHFVPWCKKSRATRGQSGVVRAYLEIGFPPVVERYTSEVTVVPNHQVRAVCTDGSLFSHLETIWKFAPGDKDEDLPASCKVNFYVSFEFKSLLHSQLASVFFDEVVKQMVSAFESRAAALYRNRQEAPLKRRST
uniref:Coenzyme Q-binding protein COQ10 START domain-containing protein n=1 Tax=Gasterosteus aculeatus aculeatus TaxID=481459 RepID=G3P100_GASAC|nr:coenzyme Q-binding protein COQ10 homolog, mitochondrial [Gasterosteus aculeatus aculeatus]